MDMKKLLVFGVIFLFIGVAIAPSINFTVVKASSDNDLVEVTTQACGIKGFGNTTVKLTRQQYQNLEQYLVDFRARLNQTTTREEAVPIFKEAVVELNKYGLLPKGMSVEQAQRLATGPYQNTKLVKYLEKLSNKSENLSLLEGNAFCLIYGEAESYTYFQGPVSKVIFYVACILDYILIKHTHLLNSLIGVGLIFLELFLFYFSMLLFLLSDSLRNFPYIGGIIYYGDLTQTSNKEHHYSPAEGSIWTIGAFGIRHWNGSFYGNLPFTLTIQRTTYYPGVNGFTGLRLSSDSSEIYFGSALRVKIGSEIPT